MESKEAIGVTTRVVDVSNYNSIIRTNLILQLYLYQDS